MRLLSFFPLAVIAAFAGCTFNPPTALVSGTVTYDGEPLKTGTIIFESADSRPATGKIVEGKIVEVTTFAVGDGAPLGQHKVAIQSLDPGGSAVVAHPGDATGTEYMGGGSILPSRYGDPATSGLTANVVNGGPNDFEFALTSK